MTTKIHAPVITHYQSSPIVGSDGVWMVNGPPDLGTRPNFPEDKSKWCKVIAFSSDGSLISWCNGEKNFNCKDV